MHNNNLNAQNKSKQSSNLNNQAERRRCKIDWIGSTAMTHRMMSPTVSDMLKQRQMTERSSSHQ